MAGLSRVLGKRRAAFPAIAGIILYVLLWAPMRPHCAVGLMGGLFILAIYFGRRSTAYVPLCVGAVHDAAQPADALGHRLSAQFYGDPGADPVHPDHRGSIRTVPGPRSDKRTDAPRDGHPQRRGRSSPWPRR